MSLRTAGGLDYMIFKGPFQPKAFYDSVIHMSSNGPNRDYV